jgi:AraC-like DNA-binding protein
MHEGRTGIDLGIALPEQIYALGGYHEYRTPESLRRAVLTAWTYPPNTLGAHRVRPHEGVHVACVLRPHGELQLLFVGLRAMLGNVKSASAALKGMLQWFGPLVSGSSQAGAAGSLALSSLRTALSLRETSMQLRISDRHLRRIVNNATGLNPKRIERLLRFNRAVLAADHVAHPDWSRIAAQCGVQGDHGLGVFALDARSGKWRELWMMNSFFGPPAPIVRTADPAYHGPGLRLVRDSPNNGRTDRLTLVEVNGVLHQILESSNDGKTWKVLFDAEHRRL